MPSIEESALYANSFDRAAICCFLAVCRVINSDFVAGNAFGAAGIAGALQSAEESAAEREDAAGAGIACSAVVSDDRFAGINENFVAYAARGSAGIAAAARQASKAIKDAAAGAGIMECGKYAPVK